MKKIFITLLFFVVSLFSINLTCEATPADTTLKLLQEANAFFNEGKDLPFSKSEKRDELLKKALLRYTELTNNYNIHNAGLYYNIGNIYYLQGDLGRSILNYKKAILLDPNDKNIEKNLNYVRARRTDKIEDETTTSSLKTIFFWHYLISQSTKLKLAILFNLIFWTLLTIRVLRKSKISRLYLLISFVLALIFAISAIVEKHYKQGVIISNEVVARKGDGFSYEPSFTAPLHSGTEFLILEERDNWIHVKLANGNTCWLPLKDIERV